MHYDKKEKGFGKNIVNNVGKILSKNGKNEVLKTSFKVVVSNKEYIFYTDFLSDMNEWVNAIAKSIETYYACVKATNIPVEFTYKDKKIMQDVRPDNSPRFYMPLPKDP